ncbi:protein HEXIM1-like [Ranitomeya variabilis]|uniref:protein HEXIM1-like n=1 Tax=Ranitomeya variabilis TaxID=490064 RepID=UPI0040568D9C
MVTRSLKEDQGVKVGDYPKPGQLGRGKELGKKRHRRRQSRNKRRWKPYNKLTWEEKKRLEEGESQRAAGMRAPHNTTQFLMEEKDQQEPYLGLPQRSSDEQSSSSW